MHKLLTASLFFLCSFGVSAQYYDTLPKGVRMIMAKHIQSEISSSFNTTQKETPFSYQIETDIKTLEAIDNAVVQSALDLFKQYPEAYNKLSLGTHKMEADAKVEVNAYVFGYGFTNKLMGYVAVPIYDAQVNLKYTKNKNSSEKEVSEILLNNSGDATSQTLGAIVEKVYGIDGGIIQSGFTNALGYEELGDWQGQGLGDIELALMYNFYAKEDHGAALKMGAVAPTGYVNDPDIIQDLSFGDGQWDIFTELGGGYIIDKNLIFNAWARYTYQFESKKELRVPYNEDVPISDQKANFYEKLGNKTDIAISTEIYLSDWFKFEPTFSYTYTEAAKYYSEDPTANRLLAQNTESYSQSIKLLGQFSTVRLYEQKKFVAPGHIGISYQTMLEGRNTPKYDLFEIEFRMYF